MAVDLTAQLSNDFGTLPATLLFEYRTIDELCGHLLDHYREVCVAKFGTASSAGATRETAETGRSDVLQGTVTAYVKGIFSEFLQIDLEDLNPQATFENYGLESIMALDIAARLEKELGPLPPTVLFEYQTISSLVDYLVSERASDCESLLAHSVPPVDAPIGSYTESVNRLPIEDGVADGIRIAINALSDAEVERMLKQLMDEGDPAPHAVADVM
jgi:acyl carrier protein